MTRILIFGSRSLGWRLMPVMRAVALHGCLVHDRLPPFNLDLLNRLRAGDLNLWPREEQITLLHGDGPPGKTPGAVGADKLAEGACMEVWPERRRVRRFPVEPVAGEAWGVAAARRNAAMVAARPHRAYAVHENLDQSKGSAMTASFLLKAGIPFWRIDVRLSGDVFDVREIRP